LEFKRLVPAIVLLAVAALLFACGIVRTVPINQARYNPSFSAAQFSDYTGKQINFVSFTNAAEKTDVFSYYSTGMRTSYTSQQAHLGSYFRSCFQEGFRKAGMRVLEDEAFPTNIPEFQLTITELNDMKFEFRVIVSRDGNSMLRKIYSVEMEPYKEANPAGLEKRAYAMVDKAITAVLADPEFKKVWY